LRLEAYLCPAGVPTIGWGCTRGVKLGQTITEPEAEELLKRELGWIENAVEDAVKVALAQPQFDALVSWAFNVGPGAMRDSTLVKLLNAGRFDTVPGQLLRWTKATVHGVKVELPGLVTRRKAEAALWLTDEAPVTGLIPQKVTEGPTEAAPRARTFVHSWTIRGALLALLGTVAQAASGAVEIATGALAEITRMKPLGEMLGKLGIDVPTAGVGMAVAGLAIVIVRRLEDTAKGKSA